MTDIFDTKKLEQATAEISEVTAGSLDVLILNAGSAGPDTSALTPSALCVDFFLPVRFPVIANTAQSWQG